MRKSASSSVAARRRAAPHPYDRPEPAADRKALVALDIETAALELFAQKDAGEVTVEQIAERAGISRRTFYRYFETPEEVLMAMPKRMLERIATSLRFRPIGEALSASFLLAMRNASAPQSEKKIQALGLRIRRRSPELWSRAMARVHTWSVGVLERIIAERLSAQGRDPESAGAIAATLIALVVHVQFDAIRKEREPTEADFERALAALSIIAPEAAPRKRATGARKRAK